VQAVTFELLSGTFHALEGRGERPLVFLHGFPDHPPTGRAFFAELEARGHRVLAPWLRGYAPSPIGGPFDGDTLVADIRAVLDRWAPGTAVDLVGHDWGAVLTYMACIAMPERIHRAVTMAVPHPLTFMRQLRSRAQLRASWYMGLFQLPGSERIAAARDFRLIDRLWRRWSPGLTLAREQREELHRCLADSRLAPIQYYRAMRRGARAGVKKLATPIATPLYALHGADDGCILPPTLDDTRRFGGPYRREIVPSLGHFLHLEEPAAIAERVSTWLYATDE
jgi:pimeloyl-ACP methyl ester carboxylesterase